MTFRFETSRGYLVCPKSRAELVHDTDSLISTSPSARLRYPVVDDIPRLLVDEASELSLAEWQQIMERHGRHRETGQPL
ncbi:MAG: Trm112 family protein [Planctomycetota bacterium]